MTLLSFTLLVSAPASGATSAGAAGVAQAGRAPGNPEVAGSNPAPVVAPASLSTANERGYDIHLHGIEREDKAAHNAVKTLLRSETNRCPDHHAGLRYYRQQHRRWLRARGAGRSTLPAPRAPRSCADARYLAVVWRGRAARARTAAEQWIARYTLRDFQVYPGSGAWRAAVQEVQRVYPGSSGWLLSCSASEGGHGRFVFNSQGSGAAGWLQFMPGTYAGFSWRARVDASRRGFVVPASSASLYSPLGQALAGGWALRNGLTQHWVGHGC